jgi:hypothetical protein
MSTHELNELNVFVADPAVDSSMTFALSPMVLDMSRSVNVWETLSLPNASDWLLDNVTIEFPVKETYESPVKDTKLFPVKETYESPVKETKLFPVKETYESPVKETKLFPVKETFKFPVKETVPPVPEIVTLQVQFLESVFVSMAFTADDCFCFFKQVKA